ncbi:MAG: type II toxin-antitoxin system VapC family toxin [Trueperaceae bacterium]|nr:type II toxin-antitoxin system VapC family toxin [Trueperaceae bacterium]
MTRRSLVVTDASLVLASLLYPGAIGAWASTVLTGHTLAAPELMPAETTNALRKAVLARTASQEEAAIVLAELQDLRVVYYPFAPFMERVWELRAHVTSYDAWYVALAESLDAPLATIDRRLANATGARCRFLVPSDA